MKIYIVYALCFICAFINLYVIAKIYQSCNNKDLEISTKNFIILFISSAINLLVNNFLSIDYKIIILFLVLYLTMMLLNKENMFLLLEKLILIYIIVFLCDFLVTIVVMNITNFDNVSLLKLNILKSIFTIVETILILLIFKIKFVNKCYKKVFNYINKNDLLLMVSIFSLFVVFNIFSYMNIMNYSIMSYLLTFIIIVVFSLMAIILLIQYYISSKRKMEQEKLLSIIDEYEKVLELDKINRHEMLNNLVAIKSYKNKSSNEYELLINQIIKKYDTKSSYNFESLYKLPSGIKGLVYYKISNINNKNINFNVLISNSSIDKFEKLNAKNYYDVCKILGIILDNAIEASEKSKDKFILLDIYDENDDITIYLENSFKGSIEIGQINKKGYSTKGDKRGFGLFIVNKIIKKNLLLDLKQEVNDNKFVSIISIKAK